MQISIVIKTLNEEKRIAATIESALAALSDCDGEVIIADSGSRDRTIEIASSYPVILAQIQPPARASCGIGPQLGFQYSSGTYICLLDGDMILDPDFPSAAMRFLENNPDVAGVTGHVQEMEIDNLEYSRRVQRNAPESRTGTIDRMNGGGLYRRSAIEEVGYISDRNLHGYEEFDLGVRLRHKGGHCIASTSASSAILVTASTLTACSFAAGKANTSLAPASCCERRSESHILQIW